MFGSMGSSFKTAAIPFLLAIDSHGAPGIFFIFLDYQLPYSE